MFNFLEILPEGFWVSFRLAFNQSVFLLNILFFIIFYLLHKKRERQVKEMEKEIFTGVELKTKYMKLFKEMDHSKLFSVIDKMIESNIVSYFKINIKVEDNKDKNLFKDTELEKYSAEIYSELYQNFSHEFLSLIGFYIERSKIEDFLLSRVFMRVLFIMKGFNEKELKSYFTREVAEAIESSREK